MGLLTKLALLPLAPVYGVVAIARELEREAEEELYGEAAIRRELDRLVADLEAGAIDEDVFEAEELELLRRLEHRRRMIEAGDG
jgi:hypothetical protein